MVSDSPKRFVERGRCMRGGESGLECGLVTYGKGGRRLPSCIAGMQCEDQEKRFGSDVGLRVHEIGVKERVMR